jgi:hypothetical protein
MDTRLRVARGIAKTETEASQQVFETLKQRGHPDAPPPLVSDGWGGIDEAIIRRYKKQGFRSSPQRALAMSDSQVVQSGRCFHESI